MFSNRLQSMAKQARGVHFPWGNILRVFYAKELVRRSSEYGRTDSLDKFSSYLRI